MTQAEIAGTEVIAKYMGYTGAYSPFRLKYHESLDALSPVAKKVLEEIDEYDDKDGYEDVAYLLANAIVAFDATDIFQSVVAAINFINDKKKENG